MRPRPHAGVPVIINVLANDSDPNGDPLTVSAVTQPANGTAAISGGGQNVTYTPPGAFSGTATFTYTGAPTGMAEAPLPR